MEPIISVRNLAKTYLMGEIEVQALRGVSFDISKGEFVAIMGPSGSGKSTLMNLLGCLDTPTEGEYVLDGLPVEQLDSDLLSAVRNRKIGFIFQQFNLLARGTALENVELPLIYKGNVKRVERRERAEAALKIVGLADRMEHRPRELSGGQQQRVAIARALVTQPAILLADEPTGNLDSHSSEEVMQVFEDLNEQGITVVLVTHEPDVALHAHRVIMVRDGLLASDKATGDDRHRTTGIGERMADDGAAQQGDDPTTKEAEYVYN
jgi:putative ABC transport system ATP-binding protein